MEQMGRDVQQTAEYLGQLKTEFKSKLQQFRSISIILGVEVLGLNEIFEDITEDLRAKSLGQHLEEPDKCIYSEVKVTFWFNV